MGSLREAQKQLTRSRLLESAVEVFSAKGYVATTVDDIVAAAGASRATFYLHFSSKSEILLEVSTASVGEVKDLYVALDGALAEGSRTSLVAAIDRIVGWFEDHSGLMRAWGEASMVEPQLSRGVRNLVRGYFKAMPHLRAAWPASQQEHAFLRLLLFEMQLERFFVRQVVMGKGDAPRDLLVEVLADIWSDGFLPPKTASKPARKPVRNGSRSPSR